MGWNIIFRVGEISAVLRMVYFFTVELAEMKQNRCGLWEARDRLKKRRRMRKCRCMKAESGRVWL